MQVYKNDRVPTLRTASSRSTFARRRASRARSSTCRQERRKDARRAPPSSPTTRRRRAPRPPRFDYDCRLILSLFGVCCSACASLLRPRMSARRRKRRAAPRGRATASRRAPSLRASAPASCRRSPRRPHHCPTASSSRCLSTRLRPLGLPLIFVYR